MNWARSPEVKKRPGRRPRSQNVFERNFGGYPQALIAAGLAGADGTGVPMSTLQRSGRNYRWSDGELMAALAEAIDYYDGRFPTCGEYTRFRELQLETEAGRLAPRRIPAMNGFQRRFGGWGKTQAFYWEWLKSGRGQGQQEAGGSGASGGSGGGSSGGGDSGGPGDDDDDDDDDDEQQEQQQQDKRHQQRRRDGDDDDVDDDGVSGRA